MKNIIVPLLLASLLAACSSHAVKDAAPKASAPVAQTPPAKAANANPVVQSKVEVNPLTDPNNILSKRSIYFDYDHFTVKSEYQNQLAAHAKYIIDHPQVIITIQGNADERGSREYNLALGQKRSVSVKQALNLLGVSDKQIETISFGNEKPKALGHDETAWSQNRRADIVYPGE